MEETMKDKIQLQDFLTYQFMSNITSAKDEKQVAYVRSQCNEQKNNYKSCLWLYDGKQHRQLTSFGQERMFIWEDDHTVLFANMRDEGDLERVKKGEELTTFYRIRMDGGEAQKAFTIPLAVNDIKIIAEGCYAFTANYDLVSSHMYMLDEKEKNNVLEERKAMQDYEILDELPFYGNGAGFTNKTRNALFLYNEESGHITRISEETYNVSSFALDESNEILYYVGEDYTTKPKNKESIYRYNIGNQINENILSAAEWSIYSIVPWATDLLVIASEQKQYGLNENPKFYMYDEDHHSLKQFANYEDSIGSSVGSDCRYGGGNAVKLYKDNLYFITTIYHDSHIYALNKTGIITPIVEVNGSIDAFDIANDEILFVGMLHNQLQELYAFSLQTQQLAMVSTWNIDVMINKDIRPYERVLFEQDGVTLYGWVLTPHNYDPNQKYPAILDIHGGPKTVYGEVYYHEMQVWANMGYFVFFMNPRGGDGRGNTFMDLRGKYGTIDYDDIMKFTDVVLDTYPAIDSTRMGVTGGSYGGFMTNWIIGHTNRFQAAASQRSIANWVSFANTSDIGDVFGNDQQGSDAWHDMDKLWFHSPLKYADQVTTPTLFIHSDEDYRCPLSEGIQMYSALQIHGVDTRMCIFHGENHELSRSGKPKHRVKRLEEITAWMEKYLNK